MEILINPRCATLQDHRRVMTLYDTLKKAKSLIKKGWIRGQAKKDGSYCSIGALYSANEDNYFISYDYLLKAVRRINKKKTLGIAGWNDAPQRTKKQVIRAFDVAISMAKKEGI